MKKYNIYIYVLHGTYYREKIYEKLGFTVNDLIIKDGYLYVGNSMIKESTIEAIVIC